MKDCAWPEKPAAVILLGSFVVKVLKLHTASELSTYLTIFTHFAHNCNNHSHHPFKDTIWSFALRTARQ